MTYLPTMLYLKIYGIVLSMFSVKIYSTYGIDDGPHQSKKFLEKNWKFRNSVRYRRLKKLQNILTNIDKYNNVNMKFLLFLLWISDYQFHPRSTILHIC